MSAGDDILALMSRSDPDHFDILCKELEQAVAEWESMRRNVGRDSATLRVDNARAALTTYSQAVERMRNAYRPPLRPFGEIPEMPQFVLLGAARAHRPRVRITRRLKGWASL